METALDLPPLIASRYMPVRLIGKGGMGAVYEVEHARTGEHLALKVLLSGLGSSDAIERFKREARASARIKSEYVVRVTDADIAPELEGAPFLVMELLEGIDLEQAAVASPPPASVVGWLRQVAQAIDKAHVLGIIHRDLKPENGRPGGRGARRRVAGWIARATIGRCGRRRRDSDGEGAFPPCPRGPRRPVRCSAGAAAGRHAGTARGAVVGTGDGGAVRGGHGLRSDFA